MTPESTDHLQLEISAGILAGYKRYGYEPKSAIAELVDNSVQSFLDNEKVLTKISDGDGPALEVRITYEKPNNDGTGGLLRVFDNAMGMDWDDLREAVRIGKPPVSNGGLNEFGMGMKTAAFWTGNTVTIRTSKLGDPTQYEVVLSLDKLIEGDMNLDYNATPADANDHYTIIDITDLGERKWMGKAVGTIKKNLAGTYLVPLRTNKMLIEWQGASLNVEDYQFLIRNNPDTGEQQKVEFEFETSTGRKVKGWAAILETGSRAKAGFTQIRRNKALRFSPDAWKPDSVFSGETNNLVNQRVFGEIEMYEFDSNAQKTTIEFLPGEEDDVLAGLKEHVGPLAAVARDARYRTDGNQGPSDLEIKQASEDFARELGSPEIEDLIYIKPGVTPEEADVAFASLMEATTTAEPNIDATVGESLKVSIWLSSTASPNDPYVASDSVSPDSVSVVINTSHPHFKDINKTEGVLNYFRECTFDAIAEWQARRQNSDLTSSTIKYYKDSLLRLGWSIENSD